MDRRVYEYDEGRGVVTPFLKGTKIVSGRVGNHVTQGGAG